MSAPVPVDVDVLHFSELFGASLPQLAVDSYQRGFVWIDEKIQQLADDLADYQQLPAPKPPYYMGTVLVHRHAEKGKRFIMDGQQRLTALCVLHQQLKGNLPANCALTYSTSFGVRSGAFISRTSSLREFVCRSPLIPPAAPPHDSRRGEHVDIPLHSENWK